jgi:CubicO group peptidase (beta-lactamase class C family)
VPGDFGVSAGGIQSSVTDMARFLSLQFCDGPAGGAQILGGTTLREMRASLVPAPNWMWGYGIGWELEHIGGYTGICHSGGTHGFASKVRAVPDLKLGFVVLMNQDTDSDKLSRAVVELLIPAFEKVATTRAHQEASPLPAYAATFTGHYAAAFGEADIVIREGRLLVVTTEAGGATGAPWLLEVQDERTLRIVSGSGNFDGQTMTFQPQTETEPASIGMLGVTFPRTGPSRAGGG